MVNWKAANYAAGIFSVLVFIITTILFVMYLVKTPELQQGMAKIGNKVALTAQNFADNRAKQATVLNESQQIPLINRPVRRDGYQRIDSDDLTEPLVQGGALGKGSLAAIILEIIALGFSAIVWGITFGQATTGYKK